MNSRIAMIAFFVLAIVLVGLVAAQTSNNTNSTGTPSAQQGSTTKAQQHKEKLHLPPNFSADDAYKQNCTRCHSEVPKVNERMTKTILKHMRVRANLTRDEAKAILEYLTQ